MNQEIDFYFDFSSPYGYLAAQEIDRLEKATGRKAVWHPILLGAIFKTTGSEPLLNIPLKGDYARHDLARTARRLGVPFRFPEVFPFPSVPACRAFLAVAEKDPDGAVSFAKALYRHAFAEGGEISAAQSVLDLGEAEGLDRKELERGITSPEIKARLHDEMKIAVERGVFGSPFFIVDGEAFWGRDRMSDLENWIKTGGW